MSTMNTHTKSFKFKKWHFSANGFGMELCEIVM